MPITCTGGVVCLLLCITKCYIFNWNVAVLVKNWSNSFWVSLVHVIIINNHLLQLYMNILFFPILRTSTEREVKKKKSFYSREQQVVVGEKSWGFSLGNSTVHHSLFSGIITVCNW